MIGVKYNYVTYNWEAKVGQKVIGKFQTKEEAMKCYDDKVKQLFTFPILNEKNEVNNESEETD